MGVAVLGGDTHGPVSGDKGCSGDRPGLGLRSQPHSAPPRKGAARLQRVLRTRKGPALLLFEAEVSQLLHNVPTIP